MSRETWVVLIRLLYGTGLAQTLARLAMMQKGLPLLTTTPEHLGFPIFNWQIPMCYFHVGPWGRRHFGPHAGLVE